MRSANPFFSAGTEARPDSPTRKDAAPSTDNALVNDEPPLSRQPHSRDEKAIHIATDQSDGMPLQENDAPTAQSPPPTAVPNTLLNEPLSPPARELPLQLPTQQQSPEGLASSSPLSLVQPSPALAEPHHDDGDFQQAHIRSGKSGAELNGFAIGAQAFRMPGQGSDDTPLQEQLRGIVQFVEMAKQSMRQRVTAVVPVVLDAVFANMRKCFVSAIHEV